MSVRDNLASIQKQINMICERVNRDPEEITIVAVTKYSSIEKARELLQAGINHLGENRDYEFNTKFESLGNEPVWHFIGSLQTRKVKNIINKVDFIHSLDRLSLAKEINKRANAPVNCFIQVNTSGESTKHGLALEGVIDFINQIKDYKNIKIVGLMTMAPHTSDTEWIRSCFRSLKNLQENVKRLNLPMAPCKELSMGMSNDYPIAIEEGATMIRIGTALVNDETLEV